MLSRRLLLLGGVGLGGIGRGAATEAALEYPVVVARPLVFPADHGAHPEFRTEWWYLTGWLDAEPAPLGFQVTFFRVRTSVGAENPSAFAARQLVIAHAALADPANGRLLVDERLARTGFGLVTAGLGDTDVRLDGWRLRRDPATDRYVCLIETREFALELSAGSALPPWLHGTDGVSAKGLLPAQASYYYSRPQLAVRATLTRGKRRQDLAGLAWLDHEWSSTPLAPDAEGWDWLGMNLDDGSALLAFQVRRRPDAEARGPLATYAARRSADGQARQADPGAVRFAPLQIWRSPRSRATWPVAQQLTIGGDVFTTTPLLADQELDSRMTTGAVYWEGASRLLTEANPVGRGYLEMTGYVTPLRM